MDQVAARRIYQERLRHLGSSGLSDEESGGPMPDLLKVPGLKKVTDNNLNGQRWEGTRSGRQVTVWRGAKWFRIGNEVRVSGPAMAVEVKGRHGQWQSAAGFASAVLAEHEPGPGTVSVQSGPDGVRIRRRISNRQYLLPEGPSIHWADLILAEQLAGTDKPETSPQG
ncbi:MAG: hypothetical protein L3K01_09880 [Thermoplasmata archaeon]|nr:hypothetical protein [Thermoplasmata archaeon]